MLMDRPFIKAELSLALSPLALRSVPLNVAARSSTVLE